MNCPQTPQFRPSTPRRLRDLLPDWDNTVKRVFGVPRLSAGYGMSEVVTSTRACSQERYHLTAYVVPYVLDPVTGEQAPRNGTRTGRLGVFDFIIGNA